MKELCRWPLKPYLRPSALVSQLRSNKHRKCCQPGLMACVWVQLLRTAGMVLLQREIPEEVNARVAAIAREVHVPVLLDCGGVEGPVSPELLHSITTLSPNETELARLTGGAL